MAPEEPANLVVVDLALDGEPLTGNVEAVERSREAIKARERLRVIWTAIKEPDGFCAVGGGTVFVRQTEMHLPILRYAAEITKRASFSYSWFYNTQDSIMIVLILPRSYAARDFTPAPYRAKMTQDGRMAIYWLFGDDGARTRAEVLWTLSKTRNLRSAVVKINNARSSGETLPVTAIEVVDDALTPPPRRSASIADRIPIPFIVQAIFLLGLIWVLPYAVANLANIEKPIPYWLPVLLAFSLLAVLMLSVVHLKHEGRLSDVTFRKLIGDFVKLIRSLLQVSGRPP
jgi:hypothetical protein